jgi:hypothetical protein
MTVAIGDYTIRKDERCQVWRIYLKVDEHRMVYVSKHGSPQAAEAERRRLKHGDGSWN